MRKVSANLDSPDWISVDRFGRTVLTKADADRDLESVLKLPPDRRAPGMDIIWAERETGAPSLELRAPNTSSAEPL
jgi:hypothetical protein